MNPALDQPALEALAAALGARMKSRQWKLVTAESCTGGWLAQVVTAGAGSSGWFDQGFVTYSNEAKQAALDVAPATLAAHGAVSAATAAEMATGALRAAGADLAIAISGVAGPDGGSAEKPVGTVWFGFAQRDQPVTTRLRRFAGDRRAIRAAAVAYALQAAARLAGDEPLEP